MFDVTENYLGLLSAATSCVSGTASADCVTSFFQFLYIDAGTVFPSTFLFPVLSLLCLFNAAFARAYVIIVE